MLIYKVYVKLMLTQQGDRVPWVTTGYLGKGSWNNTYLSGRDPGL